MKHVLSLFCLLCASVSTVHSYFLSTAAAAAAAATTPRSTFYGGVLHRVRVPCHTVINMVASFSAPTFETPKASWTVDDDTAEIEWGSSVDKVRAISLQVEEKRLRDIETLVAPMDEFRKQHDSVFRAFIARTGYSPMPTIESTLAATATTASSSTPSLSSMWSNFISGFQQK